MIAQAKHSNQEKLCDPHTGAQRRSSYIPRRLPTLPLITSEVTLVPPVEQHFPSMSRMHRIETLLEICVRESVGDHRRNVQPGFQHDGHLVPGFVHLAPVDTLDREHIENDLTPIDRH